MEMWWQSTLISFLLKMRSVRRLMEFTISAACEAVVPNCRPVFVRKWPFNYKASKCGVRVHRAPSVNFVSGVAAGQGRSQGKRAGVWGQHGQSQGNQEERSCANHFVTGEKATTVTYIPATSSENNGGCALQSAAALAADQRCGTELLFDRCIRR
jgi:hypothetical protein